MPKAAPYMPTATAPVAAVAMSMGLRRSRPGAVGAGPHIGSSLPGGRYNVSMIVSSGSKTWSTAGLLTARAAPRTPPTVT